MLDIERTHDLPLMFSPLTKDTEVAGTVRMGLILQSPEEVCAKLAVCIV